MSRISRGRAQEGERLRDAFLPMDRQQLDPSELSDELIPVYPYPFGCLKFDDARAVLTTGANGVAPLDLATVVPDGFYWYVIAFDFEHNDAATRNANHFIKSAAGDYFAVSGPTALAQNLRLASPRVPFLISEGMRLAAGLDALGAGSRLIVRALFFEYRMAELPPWV